MSYHTANKQSELQRAVRAALRRTSTALLGLPGLALAGPEGGDVIRGAADIIRPDATTTTIDQHTDRAVINWQTFNVDADEYVIFNQLDSSSVILNRVLSSDASYILGHMQANGQVFLLNPHGLFFGEGAVLDVQGFLGTTLDIGNDDFMAGNYRFTRADNAAALGQVANAGTITAGNGGYVMLAGDFTENTGFISAMGGTAALVSGNALTLDIAGDGLVNFAVDEATLAEQAGVRNAGSIIADGGMVVMTARVAHDVTSTVVNNEGLVRARSIEERDGAIYLVGNGGHVEQSGTLDANGENADGGRVILYGDNDIVLADGGVQTATGDTNHSGGTIRAIAKEQLDHQAGNLIRTTGGAGGGFVEVSGHGSIALRGDIEVGSGGNLLIDPSTLTLLSGSGSPFGTAFGSVGVGYIENQLNLNTNVTLVASSAINASTAGLSINATGTGDLFMGIGNISFALCDFASPGVCLSDPASVGFTPLTNGAINLSGFNINIAGDVDMVAQQGTVTVGDVTTSGGNINIQAASVTANSLDAAGNIDINAQGGFFDGTITVNGLGIIAGGDVTLTANAASYGGRINLAGGISAGGLASLTALNSFESGGVVSVGTGILANSVSVTAKGADGNIFMEGAFGTAIEANGNVSLTASDTAATSFNGGGRIEIGSGAIGDSFTGHEVVSTNGNISISATNTTQDSGGRVYAGSITAGGDVSISADGTGSNGGQIFIGDDGFPPPAKNITAGGAVNLTAIGEFDTRVTVGNINAGSLRIDALASNFVERGNATVTTGNLRTTAGNLAIFTTGFGSGNASLTTGTLDAQDNVHVEVTGGSTGAAIATLNVADVTARGHVDLYAGAFLGDVISVNGGITAGEYIYVWNRTNGNIGINGSVSGGDSVRIHAEGVNPNQGTVGVAGNITGASVDIRADGGEIGIGTGSRGTAFNGGTVTATTGNLSLSLTNNTQSYGGGIIFAGDLLATNGNVNVSAATGEGRIELGNSSGGALTTRANISAGGNINLDATGSVGTFDVGKFLADGNVTITASGGITGTDLIIGSPDRFADVVTLNSPILVTNSLRVWSNELRGPNIGTIGSTSNVINTVSLNTSLITAGNVNIYAGNIVGSSLGIGTENLAVGNVTINSNVDVSGDVAMWVGAAGNATVTVAGGVSAGNILISTDNSLNLAGNAFAATGNIGLDAGNGMNISGTTLLATDVKAVTGTTLNANSAVIAADTVMLDAGTNMSVSNISLDAGQAALVAGGSITNSSPPGTITAGALAVLAGNTIDLGNTQLVIGSGRISSIPGDERFLQLLAGRGVDVPTGGPNLVMRARNIRLGGGTLAGDYVYLETNNLAMNGEFVPSDPGLLLQIAPTGLGASFSLEQSTPGSSDANYVYSGALERFNAGTIALGSTSHTGDVTISNNSTNVDIDATNLFVLTNGTTTGLGKVLSTGIVKDLQDLLSGGFDVPQSDEIDITKDTFTSLDDQYGMGTGGGDDEEEGDEEGEDTADDTVEEEEDDSLIRRETAEEELMCE